MHLLSFQLLEFTLLIGGGFAQFSLPEDEPQDLPTPIIFSKSTIVFSEVEGLTPFPKSFQPISQPQEFPETFAPHWDTSIDLPPSDPWAELPSTPTSTRRTRPSRRPWPRPRPQYVDLTPSNASSIVIANPSLVADYVASVSADSSLAAESASVLSEVATSLADVPAFLAPTPKLASFNKSVLFPLGKPTVSYTRTFASVYKPARPTLAGDRIRRPCRCDDGVPAGIYCGYCSQIISCKRGTGCFGNAFTCGENCQDLGYLEFCFRSMVVEDKENCPLFP